MRQRNIYQDAIDVQDACNISGVVNSLMNEVLPAVRQEITGTVAIARHPAVVMFVSKLGELTGLGGGDMDTFSEAYLACRERAEQATLAQAA